MRNRRVFAMKVVKSDMKKKMQEKFQTELQIHSKMRHPHIVQFHRAFQFDNNIYVILELCPNGSIMDMVQKRKCLSLPEVRRFMIQLCGAVKYLHKRNVAHRDLKMGNIFLDRNMDIKVGDFGLAAIFVSEKDEKRRRTVCGTPNYIAPEVVDRSKRGHTQKVDIWSVGVICFAMLSGYPPFQSKTQEEIYEKVRNLDYVWPKNPERGNYIPDEAKALVASCLNLAEDERPDPDDFVEHPFFKMYDGCIPRQLDSECRLTKPVWLTSDEPRGDCMVPGYSLDCDEKLAGYASHTGDYSLRYRLCRNAFYSLCGVGRKSDGSARKPAGRNWSKSAYAECCVEDERGLQPVVPLPEDSVYKFPHDCEGDWSVPESIFTGHKDDSTTKNSTRIHQRSVSLRSNTASLNRTQAALAAAQERRRGSLSHAATLRQQAVSGRGSVRKITAICNPELPPVPPLLDLKELQSDIVPVSAVPTGGLAERPIRTRCGIAAPSSRSLRDLDENMVPQVSRPVNVSSVLTVGKTRSQSRRLEAAKKHQSETAAVGRERTPSTSSASSSRTRNPSLRIASRGESRDALRQKEQDGTRSREETLGSAHNSRGQPERNDHAMSRASTKTSSSGNKPSSTLGSNPLFHSEDECELLPGTSLNEVNVNLRLMLSNLIPHSSTRRRGRPRGEPHTYVIKWVDYTNRYGIGYVLDDGTVGCVFKGENRQPASCVVVRDGERHFRRKARALEKPDRADYAYSQADQLIPQNGKAVEFYENFQGPSEFLGIRRALVPASMFQVKGPHSASSGSGIKVHTSSSVECSRSDAEKVKRVKLVDQFGKYMIRSLGRLADEGAQDNCPGENEGQYIKFYQRLGNVGVWGFGDGAFQFNFPDHTKLVISPGRTRDSSPWIDFYHLSASAARYLSAKGRMHPSGFDTRAIASEEASILLAIAEGTLMSTANEKIQEVLEANSFLQKISFIRNVLKTWIKHGRLGGRPSSHALSGERQPDEKSFPSELYWEGAQELPQPGGPGGKFVWVTVGAPGGDGEYRAISLKPSEK
ncbi:hypothetical protein MAP00_005306 [Monascus purpureus]|nr:hypothetical protein MAP00_005306 [Monascus purpureus]